MGRTFRSDKKRAWNKPAEGVQLPLRARARKIDPSEAICTFSVPTKGVITALTVQAANVPKDARIFVQIETGGLLSATQQEIAGPTVSFPDIPIVGPSEVTLVYSAALGAGPMERVSVSGLFNSLPNA